MASLVYNTFKGGINTDIDWSDNTTTTIKVALVTSTYAPDIDAHHFYSDITNEVVGTGYTVGGANLITRTVTIDDVNDRGVYDGEDSTWTASSLTARGAVIYKDTGVTTTSPLIAYIDFTEDKTSLNADFKVFWHVDGIFYLA